MPDIFVSKKIDQHHKIKPDISKEVISDKSNAPSINFPGLIPNSVHILASYCENPGDIKFKNQEKNEKVILFVRKHFVTNFPWIAIGLVLTFLPFILASFGFLFRDILSFIPGRFFLFFSLFYYLFVISYMFVGFITWYFNISLVTDRRVLDLDFSDVLYKNLASTKIELVQDVSYDQTGVLRTFFHFGDVLVQTAGETTHFDFTAVPQPENVVHIIGGLIGKHGNH